MSRPVKRRRLSSESEITTTRTSSKSAPFGSGSAFAHSAAQWSLEQSYEQRPRKLNKGKEKTRLPIKTSSGWIEQEASQESDVDEADSLLASEDEAVPQTSNQVAEASTDTRTPKQQIRDAKEELARLAGLVNEDPEEHIGALRTIAALEASPNVSVKRLVLVTQLAIYKDIIPGYRIKPQAENDAKVKLSKDVRRLRDFEQSLVGGYQKFLQRLSEYAKSSHAADYDEDQGLASVAISCTCSLLNAVPHFNFRGELLKILVSKLSLRNKDQDFYRCTSALETLFQNDEDGNASLEGVNTLSRMLKSRSYVVDEAVLNTFLHLRLLSEFSFKGSHSSVDRSSKDDVLADKKPKNKREFRTKRRRKALKEEKEVEKDMREADAVVSREERDRIQAETLKVVFLSYFRILKARTPSLMGAVLEGLARYSHLINQDFFGDILEALKDLIAWTDAVDEEELASDASDEISMRNASRESLLCIITAFALLQGQEMSKAASTLHLDLNVFTTHLYRTLLPASLDPDIELNVKSLRLPDPDAPETARTRRNRVNIQTTIVLLLRSLNSALLPEHKMRAIPPTRIAAFAKSLMTASLQLPEKSCLAMMQLMQKIVKMHSNKIAALWSTEERKGDGVFDALKADGGGEGSNPFATTVWEGEILRRHFCPAVQESVKTLEKSLIVAQA